MRIVFYSLNGSGVGHVMRGVSVARAVRKLAKDLRRDVEIFFLTSSEAVGVIFSEGFPSFKMPSRAAFAASGISAERFGPLAAEWTKATLQMLSPELLVVDTFPAGYYDELPPLLEIPGRAVCICRPIRFANVDQAEYFENLSLYDTLVVPEMKERSGYRLPADLELKASYFGPALSRASGELLTRNDARRLLNIPPDAFVIYVSAGGGGDAGAQETILGNYAALNVIPNAHFVVGAGPLYFGQKIRAGDVTWLTHENTLELMPGFDIAVASAGYNSFNELMFAGVPSVFLPQEKWADDQASRAESAAAAGAAKVFHSLPGAGELLDAVLDWRDEEAREKASSAAKELVPKNYASEIAEWLLESAPVPLRAGDRDPAAINK